MSNKNVGIGLVLLASLLFLLGRKASARPPEEQPPEEPPPEEPPPEEPPPSSAAFEFALPSVSKIVYENAPAFKTVIFNCQVTNPNNFEKTETIKLMIRDTDYYPEKTVSTRKEGQLSLTLSAGQIKNVVWNGNSRQGPLLSTPHDYCFWFEGEGNSSVPVCISNR